MRKKQTDDEELKKTSNATIGFEKINKIFELESKFKDLPQEEKQIQRKKWLKQIT